MKRAIVLFCCFICVLIVDAQVVGLNKITLGGRYSYGASVDIYNSLVNKYVDTVDYGTTVEQFTEEVMVDTTKMFQYVMVSTPVVFMRISESDKGSVRK